MCYVNIFSGDNLNSKSAAKCSLVGSKLSNLLNFITDCMDSREQHMKVVPYDDSSMGAQTPLDLVL